MDLTEAIGKHAEWKTKFRAAIDRKDAFDVALVACDAGCELGQWLHGEGRLQYGSIPSYRSLIAKHRDFHTEAGRIAGMINAKRYAEAGAAIGLGEPFAKASAEAVLAMSELRKFVPA
jgi:methyl-accepting chemotaxis protein